MTRLNRILEIDEENLTATAQAGVVTLDFFNALMAKGLFYPPDPGSQKISTLGGNIAEDAGGLRGLKYGVTRDYVMALNGVLGDGLTFATGGKSVKDVAGYALKDLLVGSEGTLGIITEATFKLIPPPQAKRTLLAYFRDTRAGRQVKRFPVLSRPRSSLQRSRLWTTRRSDVSKVTPRSACRWRWQPCC